MELGEDATYPITRIGFVSFRRPAGDVPLVSGLTKNLLSIQPWQIFCDVTEFNDQQDIIRDHKDPSQVLYRGMREGIPYKLLANLD